MMERFNQLAPREQLILGVGAALAFLIIGWSFLWTPLASAVDELRESVRDQSRLMVDLKRAASLPSTNVASAAGSSAQDLAALVDQTARPIGLAPAFTTQRPEVDNVNYRIAFQNASFALFVDWLVALDREHGVTASFVSFQPGTRGPGLVSGQVVLSWT
jgi:type II secretory pathway component PulM